MGTNRDSSLKKEEFFRRNIIAYPNQQEVLQEKQERQTQEALRSIEKPVTMAGFTKKDFQRVNQSLKVLHENKVTYNYMKLMLAEV